MDKLYTYCDQTYLESIYKLVDRPLSEILLNDDNDLWIAELYKFIHNNCILKTDISFEEVKRISDEKSSDYNANYKKLWKGGSLRFLSCAEEFKKIKSDSKYFNNRKDEIYFISSLSSFCQLIERNYGLICSSNEEMHKEVPQLFLYDIIPIEKSGTITNWSFLKKYKYPSNAAVLADNFVFHDNRLRETNLLEVLLYIMPKELNEESFDLTIFTREVDNLVSEYEYLNNYLRSKLPYKINLSIAVVERGSLGIHDRDIITNYCWYSSGAGFTLFKKTTNGIKIIHNTRVYIYPVTVVGN